MLYIKAYSGMEERHRESMADNAFVQAVVEGRVRKRLREKHSWAINEAAKHAKMVEVDPLRQEQWQEFDKEDKEKSQDKKSDNSTVADACKLDHM